MAKNEEEKLQVEEDREKVEEPAEEEEPTEFVGLEEIDSLKVRQLWAGIPSQTTTPTDSAQRGELRLKDDATDQSLWARLSGAWKQLTDTRLTDGGETSLHTHAAATPAAHKTSHQDGGSDEIDATGLVGVPDLTAEGFHNLIDNGNMELWVAGTTVAPTGFDNVLTATIARDTSPKYGDYCVKITGIGATNEGIGQTLNNKRIKASTTYHVSVWAKVTAGDTARLDITGESGTFTALTTTSTTWTQLTGTFITDATPTSIVIQLLASADTDIVWFDGLQVTEGSTSKVYQAGQDRGAFQILGGSDTQADLADDATVTITTGFAPKMIEFFTQGAGGVTKVDIGRAVKTTATQWCYNLVSGQWYNNSIARRSTQEATAFIEVSAWGDTGFTLRMDCTGQTMSYTMFWTAIG